MWQLLILISNPRLLVYYMYFVLFFYLIWQINTNFMLLNTNFMFIVWKPEVQKRVMWTKLKMLAGWHCFYRLWGKSVSCLLQLLEAAGIPWLLEWHHAPTHSSNSFFVPSQILWFWPSFLALSLARPLVILLRWPEKSRKPSPSH